MKRVLIAEDEVDIQQFIGEVLDAEGYGVLLARTGRGALQVIETERPDVVLLDVMMPDGDGQMVLEGMQAQPGLRDIPVVIVSTGVTGRRLRGPAVTYLDKPFALEQLLAAVRGALGPGHDAAM